MINLLIPISKGENKDNSGEMSGIIKIPKIDIVKATGKQTASLFFFHGSGSSGEDMKEWVDILNWGELKFRHIKIIYPTAPAQKYIPLDGMISNVWYNRKAISIHVPEESDSINTICNTVSELIEGEVTAGIPYNRILVGGFSMGGGLAFHLAYRVNPFLAGCFAMSSFLNKNSSVYEYLKSNPTIARPPLIQFHGASDDLVPIEWGKETFDNLKAAGVDGQFIELKNTHHEATREMIQSFKNWTLKVLPDQ